MGATIDLHDPDLQSALDEWAEALGVLCAVVDDLNADLQQQFELADLFVVPFDQIRVGSEIRLAGEWQKVLAKITDNLGASAGHRMVLSEDGKSVWDYVASPDERFTLRGPF